MKTVKFQGNTFSIPDWANYIANDNYGVFAFENKPEWSDWAGRYWDNTNGKIEVVVSYLTSHKVEKI